MLVGVAIAGNGSLEMMNLTLICGTPEILRRNFKRLRRESLRKCLI